MAIFRWEWTLANRGAVSAVVDRTRNVELVSQGARVLSEAPRGSRPDGHVVLVEPEPAADGASDRPPIEAVVTFDSRAAVCILRVDGHEVAPRVWPVREPRAAAPAPPPSRASYTLLAVIVGALLAAGALLVWYRTAPPEPPSTTQLHGTHRSLNGLFIAHFPEQLEARLPVLPSGIGGVLLEDKAKTITIVIASVSPGPSGDPHDRWSLQQRLRDEVLANVPKGLARFEETERREEKCLGESGAVVSGRLVHERQRRARVWSCAFVHDGSGYLALYVLAEPAGNADERKARGIIDATELTRLADLGAVPEPPPMLEAR